MPSMTMWTTWTPLAPYSALRVWQSMRRPAMAAACECCPSLPRIAAVDEVTRIVPLPRFSMSGQTLAAVRNSPKVARRHPSSNTL